MGVRDEQGLWFRRFAISFAVGYLALRLLGPSWVWHYEFDFPDSTSYLAVAQRTPFSLQFWFDERPPTYPLLLWMLSSSHLATVVVQTALSFAAWIWLIRSVIASIDRRSVSYPAVAMLIAIWLQARWIFWNTLILTESLSATLAIAMVAGWLQWWRSPTPRRTWVLTAIIAAWMCLRDSNAIGWLALAVPAAVVLFVLVRRTPSPRRRAASLLMGVSLAVGAYAVAAQNVSNRAEPSFANNVGLRWLPDAGMTEFMVARGMPLDTALQQRTGKNAWDDGEAFLRSPALSNYRQWARSRGRFASASSFVWKSPWYVHRFANEASGYADPRYLFDYDEHKVHTRFPDDDLGPLDPVRSLWSLIVWGVLGAASIAAIAKFERNRGLWLGLLWTAVITDTYLAFSGDAVEVARHLAGPWLRFSVVSILVVATAIDVVLTERVRREPGEPTTEPSPTPETSVAT